MNEYRMFHDIPAPQKLGIKWSCVTQPDDRCEAPDENDEGFWPSRDPKAAGWCGDEPGKYEEQLKIATDRMNDWKNGSWWYVGVKARATLSVPIGGGSFAIYVLTSPGLWGIESDCEDYIKEVYEEEKATLLDHLRIIAIQLPTVEEED